MRRRRFSQQDSQMILPLTSMVDMFTILLVFLLKSFSTAEYNIKPPDNTLLPSTESRKTATEVAQLILDKEKLIFADKKVIDLSSGGTIASNNLDKNDRKMIRPLFEALDSHMQQLKAKNKAENNSDKSVNELILLADADHSYQLLQKVFYTASMAGFTDLKMAGMSAE